jgi:hypothetical protein
MLTNAPIHGREFLHHVRQPDGGWSYRSGAPSSPEPTCLAMLALDERDDRWLAAHEHAGAITLPGDDEPHWTTALAVLALSAGELRDRLIRRLLAWHGERIDPQEAVKLDNRLRGWPWADKTFSWVEPTSYAVLALKVAGQQAHPRVAEAERLLLDRQCRDGGWNYGNHNVLGTDLESFVPTTALAAMALQGAAAARPAVERGLVFIASELKQEQSALSLALAILCYRVYRRDAAGWVEALASRQQPDGSWRGEVHLSAWAVLALGERNVF